MNLNLVPKQLPSIILAATANSSPASHFSPLKNPFFLLAATELPRSLAREMISQQACGPGAFHRWMVGMDACVYFCVVYVHARIYISVRELIVQWVAINGLSQSISLQENGWEQKAHQTGQSSAR